jgi:hypothetical protein
MFKRFTSITKHFQDLGLTGLCIDNPNLKVGITVMMELLKVQ